MSTPTPYKFCDLHFKVSCPICIPGAAQPTPVNDEPVQKMSSSIKIGETTVVAGQEIIVSVAEPVLTDPAAQKIVESAHSYARAREAVSIISVQVSETRQLLAALEKKLKETIEISEAAQDELRNATTKTVNPA
jgi:hypothetical protein